MNIKKPRNANLDTY